MKELSNPVVLIIVLGALSLAPFVLIMMTSFVKISVTLSILRNALGTQQVPPNQVITGLAFVLTLFVMSPVAERMYEAAGSVGNSRDIFSEASVKSLFDASQKGKEPLRKFLSLHSHPKDRLLFMELAAKLDRQSREALAPQPAATTPVPAQPPVQAAPQDPAAPAPPQQPEQPEAPALLIDKDDFRVLIPSFVTSELKNAFQIGFLIFVPFLVIDMVVANILLSMGMSMLSPSVISLPFKLLLFVLVDGWFLLIRGLVLSYT
jgi:type III secretion protein R